MAQADARPGCGYGDLLNNCSTQAPGICHSVSMAASGAQENRWTSATLWARYHRLGCLRRQPVRQCASCWWLAQGFPPQPRDFSARRRWSHSGVTPLRSWKGRSLSYEEELTRVKRSVSMKNIDDMKEGVYW